MRKQKAYYQESNDADFVNTDKLLDQVISLPMHTELEEEQLKFITDSVKDFGVYEITLNLNKKINGNTCNRRIRIYWFSHGGRTSQ